MISGIRMGATVAASAIVLSLAPASAQAADTCAPRSEVRTQISELVHGLKDDVESKAARKAVQRAFVETMRSARGEKAETKKEKKHLGLEVSTLARTLKDTKDKVERKAIVLQIKALRQQGKGSDSDAKALKRELKNAAKLLRSQTDTKTERREVSEAVRALQAQFGCKV